MKTKCMSCGGTMKKMQAGGAKPKAMYGKDQKSSPDGFKSLKGRSRPVMRNGGISKKK